MTGLFLALGLALIALVGFAWRQHAIDLAAAAIRRPGHCPLCQTPVALGGTQWTCLMCGYRSELDHHPDARRLLQDHATIHASLRQLSLAADQFAREGDTTVIGTTTVTALRRVGVVADRYPHLLGQIELSLPRDRVDLIHRIEDVDEARKALARAILVLGPIP